MLPILGGQTGVTGRRITQMFGRLSRAMRRPVIDTGHTDRMARELASIVDSSDDAIIGKDLNGIVTSWNRSAERLFGYSADEMIGQSILTIIPAERRREEDLVLGKIRRGETVDHFETIRQRRDGALIPISLTVSPIRDATGRVIGASKIARDITERTRVEAALSQAKQEAEHANRVKDEFLATLSHELRTPLNAVLGFARMLRAGAIETERQPRALEILERNATVLTRLVDDLLDVSGIVSGKTRLDVQMLELAPIIDQVLATIRPAADAKGVQLLDVLDRRNTLVSGDPDRLQQIVWNLLTNAVKFTDRAGRVEVRLAGGDAHVEIIVSDSGQGIAPALLPHVFDRFRLADGSSSRQRGGLGLGLAICRHLVELHGGTISVSSDGEGQGSTFRVELPLGTMRPDALPEVGHAPRRTDRDDLNPSAARLDGVRVFIVDDEPDTLVPLCEALERSGAIVTTFSSADDVIEALQVTVPDLLVSDIGMPVTDGFELLRTIQQRPERAIRQLPVVALTGYAQQQDRTRMLAAGFHAHLAKPIDPAELVAAVAAMVRPGDQSDG
jgi:PAS domain S-box-containing protein